jgi:hypothetical protein
MNIKQINEKVYDLLRDVLLSGLVLRIPGLAVHVCVDEVGCIFPDQAAILHPAFIATASW